MTRTNELETIISLQSFKKRCNPIPLSDFVEDRLGVISTGSKVENLNIISIERECTRCLREMLRQILEIFVEFYFLVAIALKFLESDRLVPNDRNFFSMLTARQLWQIAPLRPPFGMKPNGIIP